MKRSRKALARAKLIAEADALVRQLVFARDKHTCVADGAAGVYCSLQQYRVIQAAHIFPKGKHPRLRWHEPNILTMCFYHHMIWQHRNPLEFAAWFHQAYPNRMNELKLADAVATKVDLKELLIGLRLEVEALCPSGNK